MAWVGAVGGDPGGVLAGVGERLGVRNDRPTAYDGLLNGHRVGGGERLDCPGEEPSSERLEQRLRADAGPDRDVGVVVGVPGRLV